MCNIAGYVGERDAAPVLIEMIRKQEGLNGGFYTGISVHDGTGLAYRKTQGDLEHFLQMTDAASLSGRMGIIHSRTPSGGNGLWAHPFVTERDGKVLLSYVANGAVGAFAGRKAEFDKIADSLVSEGFDIPCKLTCEDARYGRLSSGEAVHMSDTMCQLIYRYKAGGLDTALAMTRAFEEMPSEIVGLAIERESPDRIYYSRINQPMFVGFDGQGAYLCSSPQALPETVQSYTLLPPLSSGIVFKDRYEVTARHDFPAEVSALDETTAAQVEEIVLFLAERGEVTIPQMRKAVREAWGKEKLLQVSAAVYAAVAELLRGGKIQMRSSYRMVGDDRGPQTLFSLCKGT